jgi:integrase
MADELHLQRRGLKYWFIREIPKKLRPLIRAPYTGKAHFRRNLHTSDLVTAQAQRAKVNAEFEIEIKLASQRRQGDMDVELMAMADEMRRQGEDEIDSWLVADQAKHMALNIEKERGEVAALRFYRRAVGVGTEIDAHLEKFIAMRPAKPKTNWKRRRVIGDLAKWRSTVYVETITRELATEFVDEVLVPGHDVATINGSITVLSTYWNWMIEQGLLKQTENYWPKLRRKKGKTKPKEEERAFTQDEMKKLFRRDVKVRPELLDMMTLAALTGGRIEELAAVRVKHVDLKAMQIRLPGEKTPDAYRLIPMHKQLKGLIERRTKGKQPDAWLFHELPERNAESPMGRATVITKAFIRHRKAVGVHEKLDGKRRSLVNFHSFRRWCATRLTELDTPSDVIDVILGWKSPDMRRRYGAGANLMQQMRRVIDKVKLPK